MNKTTIITGTLILLILLSGCQLLGPTAPAEPSDIRRGTEGLTAEFLPESPPDETFENSNLPVSVLITNEGIIDVTRGLASISIEDTYVSTTDDRLKFFELEGKSFSYPEGQDQIMTWQLDTRDLPAQTETVRTSIGLNICYPYTTEAEATICVDTDVFQRSTAEKPCQARTISLGGGQGAPVAISSITPVYQPHDQEDRIRALYEIDISNVGNGRLFRQEDAESACTPFGDQPVRWNRGVIEAFLGDVQLDCSPSEPGRSKEIIFENRRSSVTCEVTNGISTTAGIQSSTIQVKLDYGYTFTTTEQVRIKRIR